MKSCNSRGFCT